jgi:hypothetical protein
MLCSRLWVQAEINACESVHVLLALNCSTTLRESIDFGGRIVENCASTEEPSDNSRGLLILCSRERVSRTAAEFGYAWASAPMGALVSLSGGRTMNGMIELSSIIPAMM